MCTKGRFKIFISKLDVFQNKNFLCIVFYSLCFVFIW